ncbi:hypothetical protein KP509_15G045100 [Ceratopteris richardii]|uniref:Uncharacterized protein n=1 Tax=Ceratopteris richardii TaxID=49495 RepID=A0A8T2T3Y9_CERRI|nr:hypothetical protein KP509_15G045100 [Ceratopteris richardii]
MEKEVMFTEEQKEAAAENHLSILIELESALGMEGWKQEQAICANEELERLRSLNRRHSLQLETMNMHLQNIEAVIVSAQQQMCEASSGGCGEVMASLASLKCTLSTLSPSVDEKSLSKMAQSQRERERKRKPGMWFTVTVHPIRRTC